MKHLNANVDADADAGLEYPGREILLLLEQLRQLGNKLTKERKINRVTRFILANQLDLEPSINAIGL